MKNYFCSRGISLTLKALSMVAKFLLIVYIGKYLSIEALGEYGLFVITITIALYFLGMDFYTYNSREIIKREHQDRFVLIRDQFIFHILVYAVVLPLLFSVFLLGFIDNRYILVFYLVLVAEHISQEFFRLYVTLNKQMLANILLLIRTGVWVYMLIGLWIYGVEKLQNLYSIYVAWFLGALLSIIIGVVYLFKLYDKKKLKTKIDWLWIQNGFKTSLPFFIGTLAYKVIEFSDRYMIDYYMTKSDVGVYTFFGNIANTTQTLVFTLVIMMYYPRMIELYNNGKIDEFGSISKKFFLEVLVYSFLIIGSISLFIYPILEYMEKSEFIENLEILWILLAGIFVLNLSFVPHYILFVKHKDITIRNITISGAMLNIGLNVWLIPMYGLIGAGIATLSSYTLIFILKIGLSV